MRVRCSWHWGVVFFEMTSKRDLQSITAMPGGAFIQTLSGSRQGTAGFLIHSHIKRSQLAVSTADDNAYVSDARVLATTRSIFFEYHDSGLAVAFFWSKMSLWVAKNKPPFWLWSFSRVAKEASEYATIRMSSHGMLAILIDTSAWVFASPRSRLASNRSLMVAQFIFDWRKLKRAERSGRVFVAAYCREPMRPRKFWRSPSVTGSDSCFLRWRSIGIASMARM